MEWSDAYTAAECPRGWLAKLVYLQYLRWGLTMFSVDLPGYSTQFRFEILIFLYIFPAWNGDLDENNLVLQLWVIIEKSVESLEFLREAFDVVQSVDANNYLDAFVAFFQASNTLLDVRLLQWISELFGVNADNELVYADQTVFVLDLVGNFGACVTGVGVGWYFLSLRGKGIRANTHRRLAQVSMKFCLYSSVWNPIKSLDSMPSMRCFRTGRFLQKSPAGKGVWSEKPMAQDLPCCLSRSRRSSGKSMRW